jgi:nicotinamide mononucleotide transporter PnuC
MATFSLISWLKNPYNGNKAQVKINKINGKEIALLLVLTIVVSIVFYFILDVLGTSNLLASTFSVTTSFVAAYLTFRRNPFYALAYALNDIVLIILWVLASIENVSYVSVVVCFIVFLVNDMYSFINWLKMQKIQAQ